MTVGQLEIGDHGQGHKGHRDEGCLHGAAYLVHHLAQHHAAEGNLMTTQRCHQSGDGQRDVEHLVGTDYYQSALHLYNTVDGFHQVFVVGAYGHDIMAIVGH